MNVLNPPVHADLANAYRSTFREYSEKLQALQNLIDSSVQNRGGIQSSQFEAALLEVEKARVAHSCARNQLARELLPSLLAAQPVSGVSEAHIRKTAQLLWEMAGRPDGTAEGDWRRAEQLVHSAAAGAC
jgi:hypothetical protein